MKFIVETKDGAVVGVDIAMKAMNETALECSTKPDEQIGSEAMSKAYLNALFEEGLQEKIFDWLCKLDAENDKLRDELKEYKACYGNVPQKLDGN
jgi:hypothetical protein